MAVALAEWVLLVLGFFQLVTGATVYSGICRATYLNGCMGHLISKCGVTCVSLGIR